MLAPVYPCEPSTAALIAAAGLPLCTSSSVAATPWDTFRARMTDSSLSICATTLQHHNRARLLNMPSSNGVPQAQLRQHCRGHRSKSQTRAQEKASSAPGTQDKLQGCGSGSNERPQVHAASAL